MTRRQNAVEPPRLEGGSCASEVNNDAPPHPTVVGIVEIAALFNLRRATIDTCMPRRLESLSTRTLTV